MTTSPQGRSTKPCVVLIGLRGSGKATVGRRLAGLLGGEYVDTDEVIAQQAGRSIAVLFEEEGEAGFRRREREAIAGVVANAPAVISVGGGAVVDRSNTALLRSIGRIVWLRAPADVLWGRVEGDPNSAETRPPLTGLAGVDEMRRVLVERGPHYEAAADFTVDTADRSPGEVAAEIMREVVSQG